MAGLVPAIHVFLKLSMRSAFVYMMTNRKNGILYTGVTTDLQRRGFEHRSAMIAGFTKRYGLKNFVWYEIHDDIRGAIQREKVMKHWPRALKIRLIHSVNPEWADLYDSLF
jgi:putative endonuclease